MPDSPGPPAVIDAEGLERRYGSTAALDGATFRIDGSGLVGLLGRNGAGKTTLLRILGARDYPSAGQVRVFGAQPHESRRLSGLVCCVMESQIYPDDYTVRDVLDAAARVYPHCDVPLAEALVAEFRLPHRRRVKSLSRGMRSALGAVLGLSSQAPLTCFDEPCAGLDPAAREIFYHHLDRAQASGSRTLIVSTHLIDEIAHRLDRVLLLEGGRVLLDGPAPGLRDSIVSVHGPGTRIDALVQRGVRQLRRRGRPGGEEALVVKPADADATWPEDAELTVEALSLQEVVAWDVEAVTPGIQPALHGERA